MSEFDLIDRIRARAGTRDDVWLGIGDDAAVLQPSSGMQLVVTTDNLVAERHFDARATPSEIGHLALAANLSDLAAMGATPRWLLLALTLPEADSEWVDGFLDGFLALAGEYGCGLVGGNLARGPLNIAVTAIGEVGSGQFARRTGARPDDRIFVTGTLGDAAAALALDAEPGSPLRERLLRPTPRVEAGQRLSGLVRSMIDVSDGLRADLGHLLGDHGARLACSDLPTSKALARAVPDSEQRWALQVSGGGDYELLVVVPAHVTVPATVADVRLTEIGRVTASPGIECIDENNRSIEIAGAGWDHFSDD